MEQVINRPSFSKRLLDLSGTTTVHGIAVRDQAGFLGKYAAWNCTCPRCGRNFVMRSNCRFKQKSCGCLRGEMRASAQKKRIRQYHYQTLARHAVDEWKNFDQFWADVGCRLEGNARIYQRVSGMPIGPRNYIIWDQKKLGHCGPVTHLIWAADQLWSINSAAEFLGVSKQCVSQKLQRAGGMEQLQRDITEKAKVTS